MKQQLCLLFIFVLFAGIDGSTLDEKVKAKIIPKAPWCGTQATDKISGGTDAGLTEFPWLALIEYTKPNNRTGFPCLGFLINDRYVVTSAVCVQQIPSSWRYKSVRLGEHDLSADKDCDADDNTECALKVVVVAIESTIVHPGYQKESQSYHNDIALFRLARKVTFNDFVSPICLPLDEALRNKDYTGYSFQAAGWGKTETSQRSDIKRKVDLKFFKECEEVYKKSNKEIIESQICAGGEAGKDTCNGDSGTPLMATATNENGISYFYAAGLSSYGASPCGGENMPGVYTRISSFVDWIVENVIE